MEVTDGGALPAGGGVGLAGDLPHPRFIPIRPRRLAIAARLKK
jgi:hypothetical protein